MTAADHPDLETIPLVLTVLRDFIKSSEPGIAAAEDKVKFGALHKSLIDLQGDITVIHFEFGRLARLRSDTRH